MKFAAVLFDICLLLVLTVVFLGVPIVMIKQYLEKVPLAVKLTIASISITVGLLTYIIWNNNRLHIEQLGLEKQKEFSRLLSNIALNITTLYKYDNKQLLITFIENAKNTYPIYYLALKNAEGAVLAEAGKAVKNSANPLDFNQTLTGPDPVDSYRTVFPIDRQDKSYGYIDVEFNTHDISLALQQQRNALIGNILIFAGCSAVVLMLLFNYLFRHLNRLTANVEKFIQANLATYPSLQSHSGGQLNKITNTFDLLVSTIRSEEASLKESEHILHALLDNSPAIIYAKDKQGRYLIANKQLATFLNTTIEEIIGKTDFDLFPKDIAKVFQKNDVEVIDTQRTKQVEERVTKDEELRTYLSTKFCLYVENQEPYAVCGISTNISEIKRNERLIKESEENLRTLANNAMDGILVNKGGKQHVFANQRMADMLGRSIEDIIGTDMTYVVHPSEQEKVVQRFKRRSQGISEPMQYETLFVNNKGEPIPVELTAFLTNWEGESSGVVFVRDISRRKKIEAELRSYQTQLEELVSERTSELEIAIQELESFSYSVSHDLRSPLRSIDGFSQLILEDYGDLLDENGKEYLDRVRKAAQRMAQLIDDILLLSRVSRHKLNISDLNLTAIAQQAVKSLQDTYPEHKVKISIDENMHVRADERLVRIVMDNLLDNAWKYTSKTNNPMVTFGEKTENGQKVFYVKDNGAGFEAQYGEKIFGAFQRLHTGEDFPGTGIGLATVKRIIDRHGGKIWAEGEVGHGATIFFSLNKPHKSVLN